MQGVETFFLRVIQFLNFSEKFLGVGQLVEDVVEKEGVIPRGHDLLGDLPQLDKAIVGKEHLVILVDCQDTVRCRLQYILEDACLFFRCMQRFESQR